MEKDEFILLETINNEIIKQFSDLLKKGDILCRTYKMEKLKLPYHLNIIDELHINENGHSRILMRLFCYRNENGEYVFLKSFIDYIKSKTHSEEFNRIKIESPLVTQEIQRIDLWVRDRSYALIFENKVYDAVDQDAQLHRYIEKTRDAGFKKKDIFVIYLPQFYHEPCDQSWGKNKSEFESRFAIISFQEDIIVWLKEYILPNINCKDQFLYTAVFQYIDYLEGLFSLRTINNSLIMNLEKLFDEQFGLSNCSSDKERMELLNDKISDFESIINQIRNLKNKYRQKIIDSWKEDIKNRYPMLKESTIEGILVGVVVNYYGKSLHIIISTDSQFYCQVEYDKELPEEEQTIADSPVMNLKDILTNKPNQKQLWKYFNIDDVEGVYKCFIEVIERCINSHRS